jgi:hypothetical protein
LLLLLCACAQTSVYVPNTPAANSCKSDCLQKYDSCRVTHEDDMWNHPCRDKNVQCLQKCPGAQVVHG